MFAVGRSDHGSYAEPKIPRYHKFFGSLQFNCQNDVKGVTVHTTIKPTHQKNAFEGINSMTRCAYGIITYSSIPLVILNSTDFAASPMCDH